MRTSAYLHKCTDPGSQHAGHSRLAQKREIGPKRAPQSKTARPKRSLVRTGSSQNSGSFRIAACSGAPQLAANLSACVDGDTVRPSKNMSRHAHPFCPVDPINPPVANGVPVGLCSTAHVPICCCACILNEDPVYDMGISRAVSPARQHVASAKAYQVPTES